MNSTAQHPEHARTAGMTAYVDGSAVVKRILDEDGADVAAELWRSSRTVVSCAIALPEARVALAQARDGGERDVAELDERAAALEGLVADLETVAVDGDLAVRAGSLAERHGLDALEALHLAAALGLDAPRVVVATWSPALAGAAAECGLAVVPRQPAAVAA
jgi:predicted nucleic acid-binding protein